MERSTSVTGAAFRALCRASSGSAARSSGRLARDVVSITLDTYSHAIPALQEEAAALIAGLVFATK